MGAGVLVNGRLLVKSADRLEAFVAAAHAAEDMADYDTAAAFLEEHLEAGEFDRGEAQVALRQLDRTLTRLEGPDSGPGVRPEAKVAPVATGPLLYGRPVPGVVFRG